MPCTPPPRPVEPIDTLPTIVKHRTDLDTVADRVGVRLSAAA